MSRRGRAGSPSSALGVRRRRRLALLDPSDARTISRSSRPASSRRAARAAARGRHRGAALVRGDARARVVVPKRRVRRRGHRRRAHRFGRAARVNDPMAGWRSPDPPRTLGGRGRDVARVSRHDESRRINHRRETVAAVLAALGAAAVAQVPSTSRTVVRSRPSRFRVSRRGRAWPGSPSRRRGC